MAAFDETANAFDSVKLSFGYMQKLEEEDDQRRTKFKPLKFTPSIDDFNSLHSSFYFFTSHHEYTCHDDFTSNHTFSESHFAASLSCFVTLRLRRLPSIPSLSMKSMTISTSSRTSSSVLHRLRL